jgi:hypothetical protein
LTSAFYSDQAFQAHGCSAARPKAKIAFYRQVLAYIVLVINNYKPFNPSQPLEIQNTILLQTMSSAQAGGRSIRVTKLTQRAAIFKPEE